LPSGVRTRPRLSCLRIFPADNNDAVDVIASRLRHLYYLQQGVLRATLTIPFPNRKKKTCWEEFPPPPKLANPKTIIGQSEGLGRRGSSSKIK
jgi:hypothetical protein